MSEVPRDHEEGCFLRMWADSMEDWYFAGCGTAHEEFDPFNAWKHRYDRHSNDEMIAAYNTRYKRTCKVEDTRFATGRCSACGVEFTASVVNNIPPDYVEPAHFCHNCGAEVVDGD